MLNLQTIINIYNINDKIHIFKFSPLRWSHTTISQFAKTYLVSNYPMHTYQEETVFSATCPTYKTCASHAL